MYHYAANNPVKYTDPDGRFPNIVWLRFGESGFGHDAPQKKFGYGDYFDNFSFLLGFNLDATSFETSDFTLRLWKGNYSGLKYIIAAKLFSSGQLLLGNMALKYGGAGGEIGFYGKNGNAMSESDLSALGVVSTILEVKNRASGEVIGTHKEDCSFWTTLFDWFDDSSKENLTTRNTFVFDTEDNAMNFANSINSVKNKAKSYSHNRNQDINIETIGKKVIITWGE